MPTVADVIRRHGPAYIKRFGDRMPPSHRRVLRDLADCRTAALGGQLTKCDSCGDERYVYHSCRNRSCPACHCSDTERWATARRAELLPVQYYHLVFTIPKELHGIVRSNQRPLLSALVTAAAQSLLQLAADPRYAGGTIGILTVLHTWTRDLGYHPHVHCLVPGGAVSRDSGEWIPTSTTFLVPVRALSVLFRARFMALARKALPTAQFPESLWNTPWVVFCKPTMQGVAKVVDYLARYVHRIAITNSRIVSAGDETVIFRYKDAQAQRWKTSALAATEFLRRFLQHVLPRGFHKVRYYGLLSPSYRQTLHQIQLVLERGRPGDFQSARHTTEDAAAAPERAPHRCTSCHQGVLIIIARVARSVRAPP